MKTESEMGMMRRQTQATGGHHKLQEARRANSPEASRERAGLTHLDFSPRPQSCKRMHATTFVVICYKINTAGSIHQGPSEKQNQ